MNIKEEEKMGGFICENCKKWVPINKFINTVNRNHCPNCLWSKHVDHNVPGDRMSSCKGRMKPIGLSIKNSRTDKWGKEIRGELMVVHECTICGATSINRILTEDEQEEIMKVFEIGVNLNENQKKKLNNQRIAVLGIQDKDEVQKQIFGKSVN